MSHEIRPFPRERAVVVDAGYLGVGRHIIYGLVEVDVTRARQIIRSLESEGRPRLSFTAFIVASLAKAVAADPRVQAYRDWRGRLVVFHDVDVVTMIEPRKGAVAIPHIIRAANRKSVFEISDEIRSVQTKPESSEQRGGLVSLAARVPRFVRMLFYRAAKWSPHFFQRFQGTVIVTSIGMFGRGGGWGLGFLPMHTLGLTVGGIAEKPGVWEGEIEIREYLNLTIAFDHDVVDGAPAARFAARLTELMEAGTVLAVD